MALTVQCAQKVVKLTTHFSAIYTTALITTNQFN